jgi:hypothetical protein
MLLSSGLAERYDDGTWVRRGDDELLAEVATANGGRERSDRQRARNDEDRRAWREYVSRSRTAASAPSPIPDSDPTSRYEADDVDHGRHEDNSTAHPGRQPR